MNKDNQRQKARAFRSLHDNRVLVLPNAWDPGSAVLIEHAGAAAIATTSAGASWGLGHRDGQNLTRAQMVGLVARIAEVVDVPVSADIEGGYGLDASAVAETVREVVEAGAVGVNLEDSKNTDPTLFTVEEQSERIRAARAAATSAGLPEMVINARTDLYLLRVGDPAGRLEEVLRRAEEYAAAGADVLFVPGLLDLDSLAAIASRCPLPVNAMAVPGAPTVEQLAEAGVRRVSVGGTIAQAAYRLVLQASEEILAKGTYATLAGAGAFADIDGSFARR